MKIIVTTLIMMILPAMPVHAKVKIDSSQREFYRHVNQELKKMRAGKRGFVCQILVQRLDEASATLTIQPLTRNDNTWHPNDKKGKRSHVEALDTKIRDAARSEPTESNLFLYPDHINPKISVFRVGLFVRYLALGTDLVTGQFDGNYLTREKRSVFFQNAWRDAIGFELVEMSARIDTPEYINAKDAGLLIEEFASDFPILETDDFSLE